ncbi:GMC family oxidoreductase [Litoreibacter arenae]|uniref:Choline dehydrogenase n=1 Tax=Litoreibacter arenae DSM 19593 TaxID=1123360 RepID=S9RT93_9RHOB|nr:GMC family oxidoreductase [Litoreibacter arenae]EPX77149.1 Choline dehydrogenase [Litoreibacter arenae DSM 19593]
MDTEPFDYVVVGSGAGGGTLAARLAEEGMRVLLLEAGGDPRSTEGGVRHMDGSNRMPDDYDVPAFHPFASENEALRWDFYVNHYADADQQARDPKALPEGVLYPRAGTLGGCTAHNAMILVYPHNEDWHTIQEITGDDGWSPDAMHRLFRKIEKCSYRPIQRALSAIGIDRTRHGFAGWLSTQKAIPRDALRDDDIMDVLRKSLREMLGSGGNTLRRLRWFINSAADPNDIDRIDDDADGMVYTPLTTKDGVRVGTRERVLDVATTFPERLVVELDALATKVILDADNRATGVEYLKGARLYQAHAEPNEEAGETRRAFAKREVILAGGAFNTPQLLMLSGIGDPEELEPLGIEPRVTLKGVGRNLQDRYEVAVVNRMAFDCWDSMKECRYETGDPLWKKWRDKSKGLYATNGAALAVIRRSSPQQAVPDLFCMALLGKFSGYYPGYAADLSKSRNHLSWAILKAHTLNRAGRVRLASNNPRDRPIVDFNYFEDGEDVDLQAVVEGVKFVRHLSEPLKRDGRIEVEEVPGPEIQSDAQIAQFIRDECWGHHASCSCPIGAREDGGVLDGRLRVHGVDGLRIADASVFPRIPGFFIASSVYMIGEKAAELILEDAQSGNLKERVSYGT